ncbi:hypothetical protein MPC4_10346 [Methylocella tundrae]|uniref:Uncharacterized protein n=1 Tax=Methylocella tundrae TaxID=227605 RepID=A0A8B6M0Q2_METTU|nr:hypothetical protein MPC4_10346 [Methylocella tundrae]
MSAPDLDCDQKTHGFRRLKAVALPAGYLMQQNQLPRYGSAASIQSPLIGMQYRGWRSPRGRFVGVVSAA